MLNKKLNKKNLQIEDQLYLLTYFDQQSEMPNEKYYYKELMNKIDNSVEKERFAVVYLKVNNLENMHNLLGFEKSNEFIRSLAEHLQDINKKAELISLYRGNQFLLLYDLDNYDIVLKKELESLLKKINKFIKAKNYDYLLKINLGIAIYPDHGKTATELMTKVHNAMYSIENNTGSYQIYDENVFLEKIKKESLKQDLKEAIENQDFYIKYQPKVQTNNEEITALEALIRWKHYKKGDISPGIFIPLAEKTGLIKNVGTYVLKEVFETLKSWQKSGLSDIKMCINISLIELNDPEILNNIKFIADSYFIDNSLIEFEITERSFIEISEDTLNKLKEMGFSIALDDFGTGYSSLSVLNELSIDLLKLDKSFIDKIDKEKTRMLVEGVINISHRLGLKVVAEGVEKKEQLDILKELSCDYIQGYYFYRPMSKNKIENLLN
ncbi:MAG: putative bifunctional diguanylate cyclase/phosphodiesterase [bacterium]